MNIEKIEHTDRVFKCFCKNCNEWVNEKDTEFLDISEDFYGYDLITFICNRCKTKQRSNVLG
jgi:RNase P subunit RPR2